MTNEKESLEEVFKKQGHEDFHWIDPGAIEVAQWVRMKCMYGCSEYGRAATCPPNVPSISECEKFFREYRLAVVFHYATKLDRPEDRHAWTRKISLKLLKLERAIFLKDYPKVFLLFMDSCGVCDSCTENREDCKEPSSARPTPEALGMDVYSTVRSVGYPIEVLTDYSRTMNRYAFLLIA